MGFDELSNRVALALDLPRTASKTAAIDQLAALMGRPLENERGIEFPHATSVLHTVLDGISSSLDGGDDPFMERVRQIAETAIDEWSIEELLELAEWLRCGDKAMPATTVRRLDDTLRTLIATELRRRIEIPYRHWLKQGLFRSDFAAPRLSAVERRQRRAS